MSDSPIADPIIMLFEQIIWDESVILFVYFSRFDQLVRLLPVAAAMRELQVTEVRRVPAFRHGNDMVDRRG